MHHILLENYERNERGRKTKKKNRAKGMTAGVWVGRWGQWGSESAI